MLELYDAFYLASLSSSDNETKSYHRALNQLVVSGVVDVVKYSMSMYHCNQSSCVGGPKTVVTKLGLDKGLNRDELERIFHEIKRKQNGEQT